MNIQKRDVSDIVEDNFMQYSVEVLTDRVIPTIQDGFKPVQRRIMFILKNNNITKLTKSMSVTGDIAKVHPHGTTYGAIVAMVQKDNWQVPMIDGHGNFSMYASRDLQEGADRYTEIKISDFGKKMTELVPLNVVPTEPSFDGSYQLPVVIPVTFPTVLIQSQSGIGVGFSSSTLSYNMKEVAKEVARYIDKNKVFAIYPDFPTKGYIIEDKAELKNSLTGGSKFTLRANIKSVDKQTIRITEIPYGVKYETVIDKIIKLVKDGKLKGVTDVKDLNDFNGLSIEVYTRKNANHNELIKELFKKTPLQSNVNSNPNLIDIRDGKPAIYGLKDVVSNWVDWRLDVYRKQVERELSEKKKQLHELEALKIVLQDIDKTINIIRFTKKEELLSKMENEFGFDNEQAKYVINMKIYNINKDYIEKRIKEVDELENTVKELTTLVGNDTMLLQNIKEEVLDIANKYGVERQTKLLKEDK